MTDNAPFYDDALHMMEKIGGSFVKALADCYCRADPNNKARLIAAFPEIFERYERLHREWKDRRTSGCITDSEGGKL